jgi:hypothetical protein
LTRRDAAIRFNPVIESIVSFLYYPIVATLLLALLIRRPGSERKRMAVLGWAGLLLALRASAWLFERLRIPATLLVVPVAAAAVIAFSMRGFLVPFRLRCAGCGERLALARVLTDGANLCARCADARARENTP